jgi:hypothetical protein
MKWRQVFAVAALAVALPAQAGELRPEEAKAFVAGKLFSYTCFEGTTGAGRIQADGSVAGTIRVRGTGPARYVTLPPGTIRVKSTGICASVRGMPMEPCFSVVQVDSNRFRGSIAGLSFAYCDFVRRDGRVHMAQSGGGPAPVASATATGPTRE